MSAPGRTRPATNDNETNRVDSSGFRYFSAGELGAMHAMAHDMLDEGLLAEGLERLGEWLDGRSGGGSQWVHLQWHMAVFEIAGGKLDEAHARFQQWILPAVAAGEALTDGPSLLWRLWLAGGRSLELEWGPVRDAAINHLDSVTDPYVALHNLLALAGARDVVAIDRWLDSHYECCSSTVGDRFLLRMAWALRTFANRDFEPSATLLEEVQLVQMLGGSRAQNELFEHIRFEASSYEDRRAA